MCFHVCEDLSNVRRRAVALKQQRLMMTQGQGQGVAEITEKWEESETDEVNLIST